MAYGAFTTNEFVGVPYAPGMDPGAAELSFLVLARCAASSGFLVHNFCCNITDASASRFFWYNNNGSPYIGYSRNFGTTDAAAQSAGGSAPTSGWHAFAVSDRAGQPPRLFSGPVGTLLNEMAYGSQTAGVGAPTSETANWRVGNSFDGNRPYHDAIFAFMYWTRALSQAELNQYAQNPWLTGDQKLHFVFNEGLPTTGGTQFDRSVYRNHGSITGTLSNVTDPLIPRLSRPRTLFPWLNSVNNLPAILHHLRQQGAL